MSESQAPRLSAAEHRLLKSLSVSARTQLSSAHRLRFEMLGLLQDGPGGLRLTPKGLAQAEAAIPEDEKAASDHRAVKRDKLGRRMPHRRTLSI